MLGKTKESIENIILRLDQKLLMVKTIVTFSELLFQSDVGVISKNVE